MDEMKQNENKTKWTELNDAFARRRQIKNGMIYGYMLDEVILMMIVWQEEGKCVQSKATANISFRACNTLKLVGIHAE